MKRRALLAMILTPCWKAPRGGGVSALHRAVSRSMWDGLYPSRLKARFEWMETDAFLRWHRQEVASGRLVRAVLKEWGQDSAR
jgi:hypothetical protein